MKSVVVAGIWGAVVLIVGACGPVLDVDGEEYRTACSTGEVRCEDQTIETCEEGQWRPIETCASESQICFQGQCFPSRSCAGLPNTCGPNHDESCCALTKVSGGNFNRSNDPEFPATVNTFVLDRFEITVGRFRRFVNEYPSSKPISGLGTHPFIVGSGWNSAWLSELPVDATDLRSSILCDANHAWTDTAGVNENLPMNCISWYEAFAFCIFDGGRLPTEAEWNYAAAGGDEQRVYPWSNPPALTVIDESYAVYDCLGGDPFSCDFSDIMRVGSKSPKGDGKWGQADLSGNVWEWNLDWYVDPYDSASCDNCALVTSGVYRVFRGGGWNSGALLLTSTNRVNGLPESRGGGVGARCARSL